MFFQVLYFGDSLRSDVFPGKTMADWESILILEEMLAEQWQGGQLLHKISDKQETKKLKTWVRAGQADKVSE